MHLSSFSRIRKYALGLLAAPFLALALVLPASAQTGTKPPTAPTEAAPASPEAKPTRFGEPNAPAPAQPKSEGAATEQQPKSEGTATAQPKPETPPPPKPAGWGKQQDDAADCAPRCQI